MSRVVTHRRSGPSAFAVEDKSEASSQDGYLDKLAKYVPAESIAIATTFFAVFQLSGSFMWLAIGLGALLNIVYLLAVASKTTTKNNAPMWYFYVLSAIAFFAWSIAAVDAIAEKVGWGAGSDEDKRAFVLLFAAFLIPALDTLLTTLLVRPDAERNGGAKRPNIDGASHGT
jgi:hypothetical protein